MGRRCLCDTIKPILKLSQLLGVIPLNLDHEKNSAGEKTGSCELTFNWKSLSTFLNTSFIFFFLLISPIAHSEIRDRMSIVFSGTDLYAFSLQTVAMVLETTILLTVGRLYQGKFSRVSRKAWFCSFILLPTLPDTRWKCVYTPFERVRKGNGRVRSPFIALLFYRVHHLREMKMSKSDFGVD